MKKSVKMGAKSPVVAAPPPFLVVFAETRDSHEWSMAPGQFANIYPAGTLREAERIVLEMLSRGTAVARIFGYEPDGEIYILVDENPFQR